MNPGLRLHAAEGFLERMLGLSHPKAAHFDDGDVLLFDRCRSVHTLWMHREIDLAFLDAQGQVICSERGLPPGCLRRCPGARMAIERFSGPGEWVRAGDVVSRGCKG